MDFFLLLLLMFSLGLVLMTGASVVSVGRLEDSRFLKMTFFAGTFLFIIGLVGAAIVSWSRTTVAADAAWW